MSNSIITFLITRIKKFRFLKNFFFYVKSLLFNLKSFIFRNYFYHLHKKKIKQLKNKKNIKVAFLVSRITQWKYQSLYLAFKDIQKFNVSVYVLPEDTDDASNQIFNKELNLTYDVLKSNGLNVIDAFNSTNNINEIYKKIYQSDIVFFSKPTKWGSKFGLQNFKKSLTCYVPYSIHIDSVGINKNDFLQLGQLFYQCLWAHYLPIKLFFDSAKKFYPAKNCKLFGYPGLDPFIDNKAIIIDKSIKIWSNTKKKIIWAPHHSIEEGPQWTFFSTFLLYSNKFLQLLERYNDELEICFKPHPVLKQKLYNHFDWGKSKTDQYYERWSNAKNGILHESIYHDTFISADGMILDSVGFITEFSFIEKPICFLTRADKGNYGKFLNKSGLVIFDTLQKASSWHEIINFIDQIRNNDLHKNKLKQQQCFIDLEISKDIKSSDKIVDDINKALF